MTTQVTEAHGDRKYRAAVLIFGALALMARIDYIVYGLWMLGLGTATVLAWRQNHRLVALCGLLLFLVALMPVVLPGHASGGASGGGFSG